MGDKHDTHYVEPGFHPRILESGWQAPQAEIAPAHTHASYEVRSRSYGPLAASVSTFPSATEPRTHGSYTGSTFDDSSLSRASPGALPSVGRSCRVHPNVDAIAPSPRSRTLDLTNVDMRGPAHCAYHASEAPGTRYQIPRPVLHDHTSSAPAVIQQQSASRYQEPFFSPPSLSVGPSRSDGLRHANTRPSTPPVYRSGNSSFTGQAVLKDEARGTYSGSGSVSPETRRESNTSSGSLYDGRQEVGGFVNFTPSAQQSSSGVATNEHRAYKKQVNHVISHSARPSSGIPPTQLPSQESSQPMSVFRPIHSSSSHHLPSSTPPSTSVDVYIDSSDEDAPAPRTSSAAPGRNVRSRGLKSNPCSSGTKKNTSVKPSGKTVGGSTKSAGPPKPDQSASASLLTPGNGQRRKM